MMKYALIACGVLTLAVAGQTWRLDRVKSENHDLTQQIAALEEFKRLAVDDAQTQADQCQARVDDARQSARRIETIIERPIHVDPQGCAVRELVPSGELRDALQP